MYYAICILQFRISSFLWFHASTILVASSSGPSISQLAQLLNPWKYLLLHGDEVMGTTPWQQSAVSIKILWFQSWPMWVLLQATGCVGLGGNNISSQQHEFHSQDEPSGWSRVACTVLGGIQLLLISYVHGIVLKLDSLILNGMHGPALVNSIKPCWSFGWLFCISFDA